MCEEAGRTVAFGGEHILTITEPPPPKRAARMAHDGTLQTAKTEGDLFEEGISEFVPVSD